MMHTSFFVLGARFIKRIPWFTANGGLLHNNYLYQGTILVIYQEYAILAFDLMDVNVFTLGQEQITITLKML